MKIYESTPLTPAADATRLSFLQSGFSLTLAFVWLVFSLTARLACQQGCDTSKANTCLGDGALAFDTTGFGNTAVGSRTVLNNTTGYRNIASGWAALVSNTDGSFNATTLNIFAKSANLGLKGPNQFVKTRSMVRKAATGRAGSEPCRGVVVANVCVGEQGIANPARQIADNFPQSDGGIR